MTKDNTETVHEPSGSPRRNRPPSPSILQQEYLRQLNQETASQAGQTSPSTNFQTATQAGQSSPSTALHAVHTPEKRSSRSVTPKLDEESSSSESEPELDEEETIPLLRSASHKTIVKIQENILKDKDLQTKEPTSSTNSSEEDLTTCSMDPHSLADFQQNILELQRQVRRCTDASQEIDRNTSPSLSDTVKPTLFHGYETENFERWLEKFQLHLERRRIRLTSDAALAELALHLAGPAESFFRSLSRSDKEDFDTLSAALRERFSSKDRVWRMRQVLSARKQGPSEPLDKYIEDLQNKFDCLELSEEEKVWFFTQGLRPDTQREVLMRQPRTFREAENAARLTQTVQQSLQDAKGNDALARMQQQLDTIVSSLANKEKPKEATISAYQYSPQSSVDDKLARLEKQMMSLLNGHHLQDSTIAAYQPAQKENFNHDNAKDDEISHLREEIRQLKAAQRDDQPQTGRNADTYDRNRASPNVNAELSRALEEIRRMQARMDGFMRTYASRRSICDICGKIGHVTQNCFHRFQQSPSYHQPQAVYTNSNTQANEPRIAAFEQVVPSPNHPSSDPNTQNEQVEPVSYARRSHPISNSPVSSEVPTISTIDTITVSSPTETNANEKQPSEIKTDLVAISKHHAKAASVKSLRTNSNQELVVRIEVCTTDRPSNMKNKTVIPTVNEENLAYEKLTSPESSNSKLETNRAAKAKVHHDTAPQKKQARKEQDRTSTKSPNASLSYEREQRTAFVTAKIHGCPVDLLVDSGACISVIDAAFLQEAFPEGTSPIIVPSTYSRVDTVSGEKLPTAGKIEVPLSFNGREFPCQFHVIENMTTNAVLGRDFLLTNDAIINFADGTLKLDNAHAITLSLKATHARPLATLTVQPSQRQNDDIPAPTFSNFARGPFILQCKKTAIFFLKFLIILLLMSPHGHARGQDLKSSTKINTSTAVYICPDSSSVHSECSLDSVQDSPTLLFVLTPVRLKEHTSVPSAVVLNEAYHKLQPG
ncbi:hypothetical protein ACROYT_G040768 [Oculina patagonica]